jgi:hypothetical protein
MAGPLACHSQRSWPVPSGQPRTVPQRPQPAPFPSLAGDDRARSGFASRGRGVVPPPTSSPCALDVSRQAGQVVGGRPPWPRGVCVGPAGCWPRCRQNAGGDPGPQALARQAAAPAMPGLVGGWAGLVALGAVEAIVGVWRPRGGHGDHPGSRSGRVARPTPRSGRTSMRQPARLYPLSPTGPGRPAGDVTSR